MTKSKSERRKTSTRPPPKAPRAGEWTAPPKDPREVELAPVKLDEPLPEVKKLRPAGPKSRRHDKHEHLGRVYTLPKLGNGAMTIKKWEELPTDEQEAFLEKDRDTFREEAELARKEKLEEERLAALEETRKEDVSRQALKQKTISIPYDPQPHTPASRKRARQLRNEAEEKARTKERIDNYYAKHPELERRQPPPYVPGIPEKK